MNKYGYIRVSSRDQNIARQVEAMLDIGIRKQDMYVDKQSGKDFDRGEYKRLVKKLKAGDELYVKSIDRLGRDYEEIIDQWRYLTKTKDIDIIVLDLDLLDTRKEINGITSKFIADLTLQILSYVAHIERDNTRKRQAEGIRIAKFGRPRAEIPPDFEEVLTLWQENKISKREGARILNTNHTTFSRWIKSREKE